MHSQKLYEGLPMTGRTLFADAHHGSRFYTKAVFWPRFLGIVLILVYLVLLPSGNFGLILTLVSFGLVCFGINQPTLGMFFLLFGPALIGFFFHMHGIVHVGGTASRAMGLLLVLVASCRQPDGQRRILFDSKILINTLKQRHPLLWLLATEMVLLIALLYGPLTAPCYTKLILYTIGLVTGLVAFATIVHNKDIDLFQLGLLAIAGSAIYLCLSLTILPGGLSGRFWMAGEWRALVQKLILTDHDQFRPRPMVMSYLSGGGLMCLLASGRGVRSDLKKIFLLLAAGGVGLLVTLLCGHRLWLGILPLAIAAIVISRPEEKHLFGWFLILVIIFISFSVFQSFQEGNFFFQEVFDSDDLSLSSRVNRDVNWIAAFECMGERPILGHGLGGYYIEGYAGPGEGVYAHNLVLELLSETGVIGAALILLPPVVFLIRAGRRLFQFRTAGGASIMPFLIMIGMYSMFTQSLAGASADLFGLVAVLWAYMAPRR